MKIRIFLLLSNEIRGLRLEFCIANGSIWAVYRFSPFMASTPGSGNLKRSELTAAPYLRMLGWAFFDDQLKLESLGLYHNTEAFTQYWLTKHHNFRFPIQPRIPASVSATYISEHDWEGKIIPKYSCKNHCDDYRAMTRFVSGVRAVVDFDSAQLPHFG
jgi:hypothetical protein